MTATPLEAETVPPLGWRIGVAALFAVLYGWFLFRATSTLIALPALYEAQGFGEYIPWVQLVLGVVLPPVFYGAALLLGQRQVLSTRVLVFAAGLAATAATSFTLYELG